MSETRKLAAILVADVPPHGGDSSSARRAARRLSDLTDPPNYLERRMIERMLDIFRNLARNAGMVAQSPGAMPHRERSLSLSTVFRLVAEASGRAADHCGLALRERRRTIANRAASRWNRSKWNPKSRAGLSINGEIENLAKPNSA